MMAAGPKAPRAALAETSRPTLPRHVRLQFDKVRDRWILLAPERVMVPDPTAVEILQQCDGERTIGGILDGLCDKYAAPRDEIGRDVLALLQDLADRGFLIDAEEVKP